MQPVKVKQRDITDCGAACLASVAEYHQLKVPVARIRQYVSTDKRGTNVLGMIEGAGKMGLEARGVRGVFESLSKIPLPAIAHVVLQDGLQHFVVIYQTARHHIEVMDPGDGQLHRYSHEDFKKIWSGVLILLWPGESFITGNQSTTVLTRLWNVMRGHKNMMGQIIFGAMVYTLIGLSTSIYIQKIVDHVLADGNRNLLNLMSVGMIALLVLQVIIGSMKNIFTIRIGQMIDSQLILGYYRHLLKLPVSFFDSMRTGEIISRINDAVKIRSFVNEALTSIAVNAFILIFSFGLMFTYYWKLALVILIVIPFYYLIYFFTNLLNKKSERRIMESAAALESQLVESVNSVFTLKCFGLEHHAHAKTESRFLKLLNNVHTSGLNSVFTGSSSEFFSRLFTIILLWAGAGYVLDREITPGELLSFYALIGYFTGPAASLLGLNKVVQNALIASDRLFEIMDLEKEKEENQFSLRTENVGAIKMKDVKFKYGSRVTVFDGLNLEIPKGKLTAIVGESGSGKSTLMAILQNMYPLESGQIFIGDFNIQYLTSQSLRSIFGTVPQKIDLFAGNIIDNIALGDIEPDIHRICSICSDLGILEFIENLPQGFNTYLGENGALLSGGQRQRIAIARALYKDPEVLILDEATSSLDSASEKYIQQMINMLRQRNKTIIIIAHRLSTIFQADKIVVLDKGKVVEEGTHSELLENKLHYYELCKNQFPLAMTG